MSDKDEPAERKRTVGETFAKLYPNLDPSPVIRNLLDAHEAQARKTESFRKAMETPIKLPEPVDYSFLENTPDRRAARASEETARLLDALVQSAVVADARAVEAEARAVEAERRAVVADAREDRMLELAGKNLTWAKVAAVSGIVGILATIIVALLTAR